MNEAVFPAASQQGETSAAEVLLGALAANGIDYFFCNPGTDFAPIVEAFSRGRRSGAKLPRPIVVPHETPAVAMAHGVYMVTGRPQAVMVHVNVGTGNTINVLADASRDQIPILLMAGRNPLTESGVHGSRNRHIHWAQEMFDQAGMVRELVKWDYELRLPLQAESVVTRALEVMMAAPRGPAYLTLPREVLGAAAKLSNHPPTPHARPSVPHPDPAGIATLAQWIAAAERPMIITSAAGRTAEGVMALANLAERYALPVVSFNMRYVCLPASHPMHLGFQPRPLLDEADLIIVLDCDVPWFPSLEAPPAACRVAQIGNDPAFTRYPMRGFPCDLALTSDNVAALAALDAELATRLKSDDKRVAERRERLAGLRTKQHARWQADGDAAGKQEKIKPEWLSRCIGEAVGSEAIIVNEYPLRVEHCPRERPGTYFGGSPAGGLGWGFGAALGAKLASPDRLVVTTLGDGSYIFANPTACHWLAEVQKLPVLTVVYNNSLYGAVRNATLGMYEKGAAAEDGARLLADLRPSPAFEKLVEASGGHGERVERPDALPAALQRAVEAVTREKRQALLNVVCQY